MSVTTIGRASAVARPRARTTWRLVSAEFLKVRKRRGLVALAVLLTVGAVTGDQARSAAADINRRLVEQDVDIYRLDLPAATLEERFLQVTHKMQEEVAA